MTSNPTGKIPIDKHITSEQNPVFRSLRECLQTKGIKKHGLFIVSGERVLVEIFERYPEQIRDFIFPASQPQEGPLFSLAQKLKKTAKDAGAFSTLSLEPPLFEELDLFGTRAPLLALKTPEIPTADLTAPPEGLEILSALGDPANLGAMVRSAAAFGASKIILLKESASAFHPKAIRAASATTLSSSFAKGPSIQDLHTSEITGPIVALDMNGQPLESFRWPKDVRILIGEEGPGVPDTADFQRVSIRMRNDVESLNAAVAVGIALYAYSSRSTQR